MVKLLFNHIDSDGNGTVEKDEFVAYINEVSPCALLMLLAVSLSRLLVVECDIGANGVIELEPLGEYGRNTR